MGVRTLLEDGHEGKAYDLTGSEALSYAEVAGLFTEVLGRPIRYSEAGALRFAARWYRRDVPLAYIAVMTGIYTVCRLGLAGTLTRDTETLLGRAPISMRQFIQDHQACWMYRFHSPLQRTEAKHRRDAFVSNQAREKISTVNFPCGSCSQVALSDSLPVASTFVLSSTLEQN